MSSLVRTFYFILARAKGRYRVASPRGPDEPTDRATALELVKAMADEGIEAITVSAFNTSEGWSHDLTEAFAREWLAELVAEGHRFDLDFPPFIETAIGTGEAEDLRRACKADIEEDRRDGPQRRVARGLAQEAYRGAPSRQRQIAFVANGGYGSMARAVAEAFERNGPDWLTNEQLAEIVSHEVSTARRRQHLSMRNRIALSRGDRLAGAA